MAIQQFQDFLQEGIDRLGHLARIRERGGRACNSIVCNSQKNGLRRPIKAVVVKPFHAIAYGSTSNNRREFSFFRSKLKAHGLHFAFTNLADQPTIKIRKNILDHHNRFLLKLWHRIEHLNIELEHSHLSSQHGDYCRTFLRSYFFFSASLLSASIRKTIPFALVSNDHAPMPVAFAQVCRSFDIPIGYIQHAEVSEEFPPLAFDFAILNNSASFETYKTINSEVPPVFIVPRFEFPPKKKKLARNLDGSVDVGLFLTSLCDFERVGELVNAVNSNPLVSSVRIQPHPRTSNEQMHRLRELRVPVGKIELDEIQVAVCQNTSSVIELLHNGLKTLQIFEYDSVSDDHYGFVQNGIVPDLRASELSGPFWKKFQFSRAWEARYSQYDPSVLAQDDTPSLVAHVTRYIQLAHPRAVIASTVGRAARRSIESLERSTGDDAVKAVVISLVTSDPHQSIEDIAIQARWHLVDTTGNRDTPTLHGRLKRVIRGLYADRNPAIVSWMNQGGKKLVPTTLGIWSALYSRYWTSSSLTDAEFEFFRAQSWNGRRLSRLAGNESLLCCLVVRRDDPELTQMLLALYPDIADARLDMRARIELGRHLFRNKSFFPDFNEIQHQLREAVSGINRLRAEVVGCARPNIEKVLSHHEVEEEVARLAQPDLHKELIDFILPTYEKYRSRLRLMEVFWNEAQRKEFYRIVAASIQQRKPFSFIRLSDGEGWLFPTCQGPFTCQDEINREKHWWGGSPSANNKARVRADALAAVASADILGIPSIYRILQCIGPKSRTLQENVTYRGLLQVLSAIHELEVSVNSFTEEKANVPLFRDLAEVRRWTDVAERTVIVSSVKPDVLRVIFGPAFNESRFEFVEIPTHFRTRSNPRYCRANFMLPERYSELQSVVAGKVGPGALLLNASGVAGKGLNRVAKSAGAVAIDVGGAVDLWVQSTTV